MKLQENIVQKRSFKFGYELEKFHSVIFRRIEGMISKNDELRKHSEELDQENSFIEVSCWEKFEEIDKK